MASNFPFKKFTAAGVVIFAGTSYVSYHYFARRSTGSISSHVSFPARESASIYNEIAGKYDRSVGVEEFFMLTPSLRKRQTSKLKGDILEVGVGTGRNLKYYPWEKITSATLLDQSPGMLEIAKKKLRQYGCKSKPVQCLVGSPELLEGQKFDCILQTFTLCSTDRPLLHLNQLVSLLRPGGKIYLLEHGQSKYVWLNRILEQGRQRHKSEWGCDWNKELMGVLEACGGVVGKVERKHFGTTYVVSISAH